MHPIKVCSVIRLRQAVTLHFALCRYAIWQNTAIPSSGAVRYTTYATRRYILVDCNSSNACTDAILRIAVRPFDRLARLAMLPDVVHELPAKVGRGFEDSAGDYVAFDLR